MSRRGRLKVGDVFQIPIDERRVACGQVMANIKPNPLLLGIYTPLYSRESQPRLDDLEESALLYLVNSFDIKIASGEWPVIAWKPVPPIKFPKFKVGTPSGTVVISYDATARRPATPAEVDKLEHRNSVSPALLVRAIRAYHGLEAWQDDFDRYKYERSIISSQIEI